MSTDENKITIPVYELSTQGESVNGWQLNGRSKNVFLNRQAAAEHIEEFEKNWYDKSHVEHAVPGTLETHIVERQLNVSRHVLEKILRDNL